MSLQPYSLTAFSPQPSANKGSHLSLDMVNGDVKVTDTLPAVQVHRKDSIRPCLCDHVCCQLGSNRLSPMNLPVSPCIPGGVRITGLGHQGYQGYQGYQG